MANCNNCDHGCGGCAKQLLLSEAELQILQTLGQIPYLPVARRADDMTPVCLEDTGISQEATSLTLQCLEQKGLISLDYDKPLAHADMDAYAGFPIHGSMALTARGQQALDLIQIQGIEEE